MAFKNVPKATGYKSVTPKKGTKSNQSPWLNIQPANPVMDIWNPNEGGSKKAQAPEATRARGAPYSVKPAKKGTKKSK